MFGLLSTEKGGLSCVADFFNRLKVAASAGEHNMFGLNTDRNNLSKSKATRYRYATAVDEDVSTSTIHTMSSSSMNRLVVVLSLKV